MHADTFVLQWKIGFEMIVGGDNWVFYSQRIIAMRCVGVARSGNFELDNVFSRLGDSYRDTLESICYSN